MTEKLENRIFNKFKKIFPSGNLKRRYGNTRKLHSATLERIECDDGWYELIYSVCEKIQKYVDESGCEQITAVQIKEEFASLKFLTVNFVTKNGNLIPKYNEKHSAFISNLTKWAEEQSLQICELTGGHGGLTKKGFWFKTLGEDAALLLGYQRNKDST